MVEQFSFEKLDVYQRALTFSKKVLTITKEIKGQYSWSDQLNRAATSITLNLAEGAGRWHAKDKANFYFISRGSAFECVPILQVLHRKQLISEQQFAGYYEQLDIMAKMLTNLVKSIEDIKR